MELRRILCNYCVTMEERSREDQVVLWYRVAKTHRMPEVAGHFPQKSH